MASFCLSLYFWHRGNSISGKMRDAIAFRAVGFTWIGPAHAFFGHLIHLINNVPLFFTSMRASIWLP